MTSDSPDLLPAGSPDPANGALTVAPTPPRAAGHLDLVVPVADLAPSLHAAPTPEPTVSAHRGHPGERHVADALERLREALVSTESSLDHVITALADAGVAPRAARSLAP